MLRFTKDGFYLGKRHRALLDSMHKRARTFAATCSTRRTMANFSLVGQFNQSNLVMNIQLAIETILNSFPYTEERNEAMHALWRALRKGQPATLPRRPTSSITTKWASDWFKHRVGTSIIEARLVMQWPLDNTLPARLAVYNSGGALIEIHALNRA